MTIANIKYYNNLSNNFNLYHNNNIYILIANISHHNIHCIKLLIK